MESLLYRYRNITVLLVVLCAQLVLLAWQVKNDKDVPLLRVWAVTAVTPVASAIEEVRHGTSGFFSNLFDRSNNGDQSRNLRAEMDRLRLQNQLLQNELESAQRVGAMAGFQARTPSKLKGARVIGGMGSRSILLDQGTTAGIRKGMAVVTPDGIVGRVIGEYPVTSQVISVTDPSFAAGVVSQKNHVHGVVKGQGTNLLKVDYIPTGIKVEVGEVFYTSGEDRVFPKGMVVGKVSSVAEGATFQEVFLLPSGVSTAPEEVFVVIDPVHQEIPEAAASDTPVFLAPNVPPDSSEHSEADPHAGTQADQLIDQYRKLGEAQKHQYGDINSPVPNFNLKVPGVNAPGLNSPGPAPAGATGSTGGTGTAVTAPPKPKPTVTKPAAGSTGTTSAPPPPIVTHPAVPQP
jgi:rod shape-determining protein MreC